MFGHGRRLDRGITRVLLLCLAVLLAVGACSGGGPGRFSDEVRENFLTACVVTGGDPTGCTCSLEYLESRVTEREFLAMEAEMSRTGFTDPLIYDALEACAGE